MDNNLKGGKLVATGSKTCIFNPNIRCKSNKHKKRDKKSISKIAFGDKAEELTNKEKEINDMIARIPGYKKWALIFNDLCKPPGYKDVLKIEKDMLKCLNEESIYELHTDIQSKKDYLFDENSIMLIGEYGGETLGSYFSKKFSDIDNVKDLEREFLKLMKKMKNMFKGLVDLQDYGISHLDIKQNNIIISNNNFKFIDFGTSGKFNNVKHFLERGYHEFLTQRMYYWYPLEYIYASASNKDLQKEEEEIEEDGIDDYRKYMDLIIDIFENVGIDIEVYISELIEKYKSMNRKEFYNNEYKDIIKKIDTYSFGMLIPFMLYNNDLLEYVGKSKLLTDFLNLFKFMIHPYHKDRINIKDAYILFEKLLDKYSTKSKYLASKRSSKKKKSKKRRN